MKRRIQQILVGSLSSLCLTATAQHTSHYGEIGILINSNGPAVPSLNGVPKQIDIAKLREQAELGDNRAQSWLAMCLYDGKHGVPVDYSEAYKWALVSAAEGQKANKALVRELEAMAPPKAAAEGRAAAVAFLKTHKATKH